MDAHQSWLEAPYDAAAKVQVEREDAYAMYYDEAEATSEIFGAVYADGTGDEIANEIVDLVAAKANNEMLGMALRKLIQKVADKAATEATDKAEANGFQ